MDSAFGLQGRVIIVTGAGAGLGRAIALGVARLGAHVVVADRDGGSAEDVANEITAQGQRALAHRCDISRHSDITDLFDTTDRPSAPSMCWSTFGIFLMRQFMETIPDELIDAARIDGASEWRIFGQIIVPLASAPMAALAIFTFLGNWDSYLWPLVVLSSPEKQTIPLILSGLRSLYWTRYDMWSAGSMLTVIPVMIIYAFSSKYFIRGIAMTGMKG